MFWIVRAQGGQGLENDGDWSCSIPAKTQSDFLNLSNMVQVTNAPSLSANESVRLSVSLVQNEVGDIDQFYSQPGWTWDPTANLAMVIQAQGQSVTGGLTVEEHDAVLQTNELSLAINSATTTTMTLGGQAVSLPIGQVLSSNLLDALTVDDLSGGPTCNPIKIDLSLSTLYGIVLIITAVPDETAFRTPDQGYVFPDLAVINIIRGGHILARHGIHSLSHTIYPLPGLPFPWLTSLAAPLQPPDYHVNVDFAVGVCGQLLGLKAP
jgi:hypothetical protein